MARVRVYDKNNPDMFKEKQQGHCSWSSSRREMLKHRTNERGGPGGGGEDTQGGPCALGFKMLVSPVTYALH